MSVADTVAELAALARPGLPVLKRPIDNTAMAAYQACPREYFFSMYLHRRGKGKAPHLVFGSVWHKILETHYRTGGDKEKVIAAALDSWEGGDGYDDYRNLERACIEYFKYCKVFGDNPSKEAGKTLVFHGEPLIELPVNAIGGNLIHPYAGKIDRVIEVDGLYYVEDHKTTSRFDKNYFHQYLQSPQMMGYVHQAQLLIPGIRIQGVRINLLHILTSKSDFKREFIPINPDKVDHWVKNHNVWTRRLAAATEEYEQMVSEGVPIDEARDLTFPGHFGDNGCARKYGLCQYFNVCSASHRLRQKMLVRDFPDQVPWNPLKVSTDDE